MSPFSMNPFDAAVYICMIVAVITGFNTGLLRSMATILGYVAAAPVAVGTAPALSLFLSARYNMSSALDALVLFGVLLVAGMVFGALLRRALSDVVGHQVNIADRLAGSMLGAVRVCLLAVLMVVIFDRIIPAGREPAFLTGSKLRPILSIAGQQGLRSLPPDVAHFIDRLKRERGI